MIVILINRKSSGLRHIRPSPQTDMKYLSLAGGTCLRAALAPSGNSGPSQHIPADSNNDKPMSDVNDKFCRRASKERTGELSD